MILYCILSYLFMLGMIIQDKEKNGIYRHAFIMFILSPILLPIFLGMNYEEKNQN
jgi:hypothetical protein